MLIFFYYKSKIQFFFIERSKKRIYLLHDLNRDNLIRMQDNNINYTNLEY